MKAEGPTAIRARMLLALNAVKGNTMYEGNVSGAEKALRRKRNKAARAARKRARR